MILHRVRTGVQGRDLPERLGPWKTVCERHRLWPGDGTRERLLQQVRAAADIDPPPAPAAKGAEVPEHQAETPWHSLVARLVEVVLERR